MIAQREIPEGKVLLNDDPPRDEIARRETLATAVNEAKRREYRLIAISPGWVPAGSTMRWQNGSYAVLFNMHDGTTHGQHFKTEAEARERLALWGTRA